MGNLTIDDKYEMLSHSVDYTSVATSINGVTKLLPTKTNGGDCGTRYGAYRSAQRSTKNDNWRGRHANDIRSPVQNGNSIKYKSFFTHFVTAVPISSIIKCQDMKLARLSC